jgi:hypothetical protein
MATPWTPITHQHTGRPHKLPTQHTMKYDKNNCKRWVNLAIHIKEMTWNIIPHVVLPCIVSVCFQFHYILP